MTRRHILRELVATFALVLLFFGSLAVLWCGVPS
jgi:hypothetical protein